MKKINMQKNSAPTPTPSTLELMKAVDKQQKDRIESLLGRKDVEINKLDHEGFTPLLSAVETGNVDIIKLLLQHKADPLLPADEPSLYRAATKGFEPVVKLFLDHKADVNHPSIEGNTSLLGAAGGGDTSIVKMLLERKADVNKSNNSGSVPLYMSAQYGHEDATRLLIDAHADIDHEDIDGETPLFCAIVNKKSSIVSTLLERKADVNKIPKKLKPIKTLVHYAILLNLTIIAKALLEHKAQLYVPDSDGVTELHLAAENEHTDLIKTLIECKSSVNAVGGKADESALHIAARKGNVEIVRQLLESKADCNLKDKEQLVPLQLSALGQHTFVTLLLFPRTDHDFLNFVPVASDGLSSGTTNNQVPQRLSDNKMTLISSSTHETSRTQSPERAKEEESCCLIL